MNPRPVRRLVTTESQDGSAIVAFDGAPPQTITLNGSAIHRLWESGPVPTLVPVTGDAGATAGNAYRTGFAGTSLYVADIPPHTIGTIPVHREDSLDYIAVLAGEIHLLVGQDLRVMRSGDVLVQCGNWHTWENRADETCRLLVVVLRAARFPAIVKDR
jgi:hypothetical protein